MHTAQLESTCLGVPRAHSEASTRGQHPDEPDGGTLEAAMKAASEGALKGILGYTEEPLFGKWALQDFLQ